MGAHRRRQRPPLRVEDLVLAVLCTVAGPLLWWFGTSVGAEPGGSGGLAVVERTVAALCAGAGAVVVACWLLALTGIALAACGHHWHAAGLARLGHRLSPAFLRRVAASALGINLLVAPGAWADDGAEPAHGPVDAAAASAVTAAVSVPVSVLASVPVTADQGTAVPHPGWLPGRRVDAPRSSRSPATGDGSLPSPAWTPRTPGAEVPGAGRAAQRTTPGLSTVAVRSGDCLWDIAAEELGPTATDLEIDRRWREWYRHNRDLIGTEADLLQPGTVLTAPPFD